MDSTSKLETRGDSCLLSLVSSEVAELVEGKTYKLASSRDARCFKGVSRRLEKLELGFSIESSV